MLVVLGLASCHYLGAQGELSRIEPELYTTQLKELLTPIEEVLTWDNQFKQDEGRDGTVLLSERVTWVDGDGLCKDVIHSVYQAHTEAGASQIESEQISYSSQLEKPILILARSKNLDGEWNEVGEKEAFLQRGRGNTASQIYNDREELVLIFPEVKAGVVTESIVILEDQSARVAGEYFSVQSWEAGWPYLKRRRVLDLPEEMSAQLKETKLGRNIPKQVLLDAPDGRWRAEWSRKNRERTYWEPSRAPSDQIGPTLFLTTWNSWDQLSQWYSQKLKESSNLGDDLLKEAEQWIGEEKNPRRIVEILLEKISLDVRYTGLEFGLSGLQPYTCETVWERKFGDCKDKANLLVQLLRKYGIESRVVLVNTEHSGVVKMENPSYQGGLT